MDFRTRPLTRIQVRNLSCILRTLFDISLTGLFPILQLLDRISEVFPGSRYEIVDDSQMPASTMANCKANEDGGYTIVIKDNVYDGAYRCGSGACLGFICHELCHVFLFFIGFTPIFEISFENNILPAYCSVEWQAKALCGELMIPYEESKGLTSKEIQRKYGVSKGFAKTRLRLR